MVSNSISFVKVTTKEVLELIGCSKKRIIFVKPAFLEIEIKAIVEHLTEKEIKAILYMETGESAIRYGFGETKALELISEKSGLFDVKIANMIRVAILVVDNNALVYMPNLAFDKESDELSFPNGFLCNKDVTDDIVKQLIAENGINEEIKIVENVIILPGGYIPLSNPDDVINDINVSIENLNKNPAVDPAKLKKISFYRDNYKIVKMQVCSVRISNKSLNIKPFYKFLPEVEEQLKSSWSIFTSKDINDLQDTKLFEIELNKIINKDYKGFLFDAGRFGSIVDVKKQKPFIDSINALVVDFKSYMGDDPTPESLQRFSDDDSNEDENKETKVALKKILHDSREKLEAYLFRLCPKNEEFIKMVFSEYRSLKTDYKDDSQIMDDIIKKFVHLFVVDKLKFTEADDIINKINIKLDWYDISNELLYENQDFEKIIEPYKLEIRKNSDGYQRND